MMVMMTLPTTIAHYFAAQSRFERPQTRSPRRTPATRGPRLYPRLCECDVPLPFRIGARYFPV